MKKISMLTYISWKEVHYYEEPITGSFVLLWDKFEFEESGRHLFDLMLDGEEWEALFDKFIKM